MRRHDVNSALSLAKARRQCKHRSASIIGWGEDAQHTFFYCFHYVKKRQIFLQG